jgi:hypothetical protein
VAQSKVPNMEQFLYQNCFDNCRNPQGMPVPDLNMKMSAAPCGNVA